MKIPFILFLIIIDAYIEENNENKYLIFALTDKNKKAFENCTEFWDKIKDQIEFISGRKPTEYKKDVMEIRFESDDNLPLIYLSCVCNNCWICFSRKQQLLSTSLFT